MKIQKPHPMQQFHDLLHTIKTSGVRRPNRTGVDTYFIPGAMMRFDMADGFPAITTKKLAFKSMVGELCGIFRGYTSAAQYRDLGCKVWDQNANETQSWLNNPYRKGHDDIGRSYAAQWTDWSDWREAKDEVSVGKMLSQGYEMKAFDPIKNVYIMRRGINQLEEALKLILTDPNSRRIVINGWRPDEHDQASIPVCHVAYEFMVDTVNNVLHMTLWQRSFDTFLAFNVSTGALMLEIFARLSGLKAGQFVHFISDAHIYVNHLEQVETLLSREHFDQPQLLIDEAVQTVTLSEVPGVFERIKPESFSLINYKHHDAIKAPMAA